MKNLPRPIWAYLGWRLTHAVANLFLDVLVKKLNAKK